MESRQSGLLTDLKFVESRVDSDDIPGGTVKTKAKAFSNSRM